ncbi:pyridoxal 5'-phosphate synthase glutaminase subunit PdxT [Clostridium brassicae]|uniref:Pyridoxal 5'-phosphate synthase subunit PdxT n=1 Tax=Clostridium brassicae TaxID=2999072 RepID=A0ABT4DDM4_9CLOT|nr:pyridoxal 5'-phosphate synthase glutaminase subunit PdxT [Clostridium brassicae]MCY6960419.1 pyridoxal 5'-phosphate synthase glutaminase subunit PdxT [Clostridium brassicae]
MIKVGVLDLQGSVIEHINMLNSIDGVIPIRVKHVEQLKEIDGLILPGGESTTIGKLLRMFNLDAILKERIEEGMPVWGTCAGMILLAKSIDGQEEAHLNVMDINVKRNAYGSQLDSFVVDEKISEISEKNIPLVFIRAPYIQDVGEKVKIIKKVNGNIVAAKEKNMLVTSFHPELTEDDSVHRYFINSFFS